MRVRERALEALERLRGDFISGESLAAELGVSRQAVHKAIGLLREEGYPVVSIRRRGYALERWCDLISPPYISSQTGVKVLFYKQVSSTSVVALEEYLNGGECLVLSLSQTAGKKRDGGRFFSPENGGIYLSFATDVSVPLEKLDALRSVCSQAVLGVLRGVRKEVEVRDTDEFCFGGKKVAGMLVECGVNATSKRTQYAVVGVGIYTGDGRFLPDGFATLPSEEPRNCMIAELTNELKKRLKTL